VRFVVRWSRRALDAVTEMWMAQSGDERTAITQATATVDRLLQLNPAEQGESRSDASRRVLFAPPLVVTFSIAEEQRIDRVLNV
jgi:hypothetical protein